MGGWARTPSPGGLLHLKMQPLPHLTMLGLGIGDWIRLIVVYYTTVRSCLLMVGIDGVTKKFACKFMYLWNVNELEGATCNRCPAEARWRYALCTVHGWYAATQLAAANADEWLSWSVDALASGADSIVRTSLVL